MALLSGGANIKRTPQKQSSTGRKCRGTDSPSANSGGLRDAAALGFGGRRAADNKTYVMKLGLATINEPSMNGGSWTRLRRIPTAA
jgi:hypothetical protein